MNRRADKNEFKTKAEKCAKDIIEWLLKNEMWIDTAIYVNNKRYSCNDGKTYHYNNTWDDVYVEEDIDPNKYLEYGGNFLRMAFEGPLYDVLNYGWEYEGYQKLEDEFTEICKKHGKYFELGYAWSLGLFDL
jgi:hypothetical protein